MYKTFLLMIFTTISVFAQCPAGTVNVKLLPGFWACVPSGSVGSKSTPPPVIPPASMTSAADAAYLSKGNNAVVRTVQSKLSDIYNLADYGGVCDGTTDNTAAFSNAIAAVVATGGGQLQLPSGTCMSGTINLPEGVAFAMVGQGVDATTIKLKNGVNADLITQADFGALTGSDTAVGLFRVKLSAMTLDGNKTHQAGTSWVLRTYGHGNYWSDLVIQNGLTGGRYSEWALDASFSAPANDLEDSYTNVKTIFNGVTQALSTVTLTFNATYGSGYTHFITIGANTYSYIQQLNDTSATIAQALLSLITDRNATATASGQTAIVLTAAANSGATVSVSASDGNAGGSLIESQSGDGFLFRGPHDSVFQDFISYGNTGWGLHNQTSSTYNGGGLHFSHLNVYMNTLGGAYNEDGMVCNDCALTTATGLGHLIAQYSGSTTITAGTWAGPVGFECRNASDSLQGIVVNTTVDGMFLNGCEYSRIDVTTFQTNSPMFRVKSSATNNTIIVNGESTASTVLFDPSGLSAFPATNCVQVNVHGPAGSMAHKYYQPCIDSALQIDNTNQFVGVNVTPIYALDVQPPQPSSITYGFSTTCTGCATGYTHFITVGSSTYTHIQAGGDTSAGIAAALCASITTAPDTNATCTVNNNFVILTAANNNRTYVALNASDQDGVANLFENLSGYSTPVRVSNPAQNAALLLEQQGSTNYLISAQANLTSPAQLQLQGPSSSALQTFNILGKNIGFYNQDASNAWLSVMIQGGLNQGTNPYLTVQSKAGAVQFQITSTGALLANTNVTSPQFCIQSSCISAWTAAQITNALDSTQTYANPAWLTGVTFGGTVLGSTGGTIYNSAGTGDSLLVLRSSSSQAADGKGILQIQNSAGSKIAQINYDGGYWEGDGTNYKFAFQTSTLGLSSDAVFAFKNANNAFSGAYDLGFVRGTVGVLKITNGSSGYGAVDASGYSASGVAGVTSTTCTQWTNGLCTHN